MKKRYSLFLLLCFVFIVKSGYSQSHKYYSANGIITSSKVDGGKYELLLDTKSGVTKLLS